MTCIIGVVDGDDIHMVGDTLASSSTGYCEERSDPKIFRKNDMLFGFSSSYRMGQLLRYCLEIPDNKRDNDFEYMVSDLIPAVKKCLKDGGYSWEDNGDRGGTFLVGYRKHLYRIDSDFQVAMPTAEFTAIGSGGYLAEASLKTTQLLLNHVIIKKDLLKHIAIAMTVASTYNTTVGSDCEYLKLKE